jgi:putative transposase
MEGFDLSRRRRCELLGLSRSTVYYGKQPVSAEDLSIMEAIDRQYTKDPCYGVRRMTAHLNKNEGFHVNHKRVRRLLRLMNLMAIYQKPNTSRKHPQHAIYPYLLRGVTIHRPNQVWATDITYIPMAHGFVYLVAILDWATRYVLSWRISTSLESSFCVEALEEALNKYGPPETSNTDQGSQFTGKAWIGRLLAAGIRISMDGKGRYLDNIFVERLWRTVKYENVYLKRYESIRELKAGLAEYFQYYNQERLHQALDYQTPLQVYSTGIEKPFKTPPSFEQLSNTQNDDEGNVLNSSVA